LKLNNLAQKLPSNQLMKQGLANLFYFKMLIFEIQMMVYSQSVASKIISIVQGSATSNIKTLKTQNGYFIYTPANQSLQEANQTPIPAKKDWLPLTGIDLLLSAELTINFKIL